MPWQTGYENCSAAGGGLAIPDSLDEHRFIWEMFTSWGGGQGSLWIGCSGTEDEGRWMQAGGSGRECTYFNWAEERPRNGSRVGVCTAMKNGEDGLWNDLACSKRRHVICEKPSAPTPKMFCLQADANGRFTAE
ncbi:tetranectin-like protein [Patiria miniata]|uniref:C-type lectin domain-containing protein n=1 Tax=Patiria miniata TaxID=46514 RepID=A0A914BCA2_PATMI|nr:tetranectin-like protein [Patiria miniata]